MHEDNLSAVSDKFNSALAGALKKFNSKVFDDDGFISKMSGLDLGGDNDVVKNVLNSVKSDYVTAESLNQTEVLLRRDINNVCFQMPEMRDVIYLTRDNIVEANTATGEVSRTLKFKNITNPELYESQVQELEETHNLLTAIKDFIIPPLLTNGEMYVHIVPYAKLFAELEAIRDNKGGGIIRSVDYASVFRESVPTHISESFTENTSLFTESNLSILMESMSTESDIHLIEEIKSNDSIKSEVGKFKDVSTKSGLKRAEIKAMLENIEICRGSSTLLTEMGVDGFNEYLHLEYIDDKVRRSLSEPKTELDKFNSYMERYFHEEADGADLFNRIDQEDINSASYSSIKGCFIQYIDPLKMIPIRLGRRVVGYYYVTTTMDLQSNPGHPNGIVDLSFQHYTRDRNMVSKLANMIISSFDKKFLNKNIQLKNEIADIVMAHKFAEGKLSFVYIPENEIVRFTIDEDANGKGHSMIEPTIFSARSYLMLNMYNLLYTLNNGTTRVHYLKSSGLNKNYAAQIQRTIRKFQSRRITIDDIYSYSGVLNKVGGMGEMVLPSGRGDYKALETDTIEAARNPIDLEFVEQQRRQALSGTGAPNLLIINAIDEVDFAKTVELANARYQSRCGALKINVNKGATKMYQLIMKYCTDMDMDVIQAFRFILNNSKQQDLNITADMLSNFQNIVETTMAIYGNKATWEDDKGNPTNMQVELRKALARKYLPQLDHDELDNIIADVQLKAMDDDLQEIVANVSIDKEDIKVIKSKK